MSVIKRRYKKSRLKSKRLTLLEFSKRVMVSKGLRVNRLSKCIIIRSYAELWFKGYVLLLELLERVMVSKSLRVNPFG